MLHNAGPLNFEGDNILIPDSIIDKLCIVLFSQQCHTVKHPTHMREVDQSSGLDPYHFSATTFIVSVLLVGTAEGLYYSIRES